MHIRSRLAAAAIATIALLAPAEAAPAKHPLPLHDGFYLDAEVACGEASTAAMLQIMGDRFEAGRRLCTIGSVTRQGTNFTVRESCQDTDTGRTSGGTLTMVIPDDRTILLGPAGGRTRYRYCPIASLPESFRNARETVPDTPPFEKHR